MHSGFICPGISRAWPLWHITRQLKQILMLCLCAYKKSHRLWWAYAVCPGACQLWWRLLLQLLCCGMGTFVALKRSMSCTKPKTTIVLLLLLEKRKWPTGLKGRSVFSQNLASFFTSFAESKEASETWIRMFLMGHASKKVSSANVEGRKLLMVMNSANMMLYTLSLQ